MTNRFIAGTMVFILSFSMLGAFPGFVSAADTITFAMFRDLDSNGQVETIQWQMDEAVTSCVYEAGDWSVTTAGTIGVSAITGISCSGAMLTLSVTAFANVTGGATSPVISYDQQAGTADSVVLTSGAMTDKSSSTLDTASPIIRFILYRDNGVEAGVSADGVVDSVVAVLTEDTTYDECENGDWILTANDFAIAMDCASGFTDYLAAVGFAVTGPVDQNGSQWG